jgi:hypothetical protein
MATILALEDLFDTVVARFGLEATFGGVAGEASAVTAANAANKFGWHEPNRLLGPSNHIAWQPGDEGGNAGELKPPKYPGRLDPGRPLGTLTDTFTCYISGFDPNNARSERAQWKATRLLFDAWYRAVYIAAHGTFTIRTVRWQTSKNEFRFGACLVVTGSVEGMIPDTTPTLAPANVHAAITVTELNVSDPAFNAPAS